MVMYHYHARENMTQAVCNWLYCTSC